MSRNWRLVRRPHVRILLALLTLAACADSGPARATLSVSEALTGDTAGFARAVEPRPFMFPADHGPHPDFRTEWWYFTGNLTADDGRDFGFQLTFFRSALRSDTTEVESDWATRQAYMGHFALTDVAAGEFHAFEKFDRGALGLAGATGTPMNVWIGDWRARAGMPGRAADPVSRPGSRRDRGTQPGGTSSPGPVFHLEAGQRGVTIDLSLASLQPAVLQGDSGLSRKGPEPGNASYYYSLPRLRASGTVTVAGDTFPVVGLAWLDREWSTSALSPGLAGWDWFALQLDDDSELMVYRLRTDDGGTAPSSAGTFVRPDGSVARLSSDDFVLEETGSWSSPLGGSYPSGWRVRVPALDLDLAVTPRLRDQELDLTFRYWEGAVAVEGRHGVRHVRGRGYVELTGYAGAPRP